MVDQPQGTTIFNPSGVQTPVVEPTTPAAPAAPIPAPIVDPYADKLAGITNEDGTPKYSTVSDALTAMPHAQSHISTVEADNARLREENERLSKQAQSGQTAEQLAEMIRTAKPEAGTPAPVGISEEAIPGLVDAAVARREKAALTARNTKVVIDALMSAHGSEAEAVAAYTKRAAELGYSLDMLNRMAAESPTSTLNLFNLQPSKPAEPIRSTLNPMTAPSVIDQGVTKPKSVMGPSSTAEVHAAWRASHPDEVAKRAG